MVAVLLATTGIAASTLNDAAMYTSGGPASLMGKTTVRMVRESISIVIGYPCVYDCEFEFKNEGPKHSVKIGFPDEQAGQWAEEDIAKGLNKEPALKNFKSWVDGKRVEVGLELATPRPRGVQKYWHTKWVSFDAGQTRIIKNHYALAEGWEPSFEVTSYRVSTGATWLGNIGETVIKAVFPKGRFKNIEVGLFKPTRGLGSSRAFWKPKRPNFVAYMGFPALKVSGNTLVFERREYKPTTADDLRLLWKAEIMDAPSVDEILAPSKKTALNYRSAVTSPPK